MRSCILCYIPPVREVMRLCVEHIAEPCALKIDGVRGSINYVTMEDRAVRGGS